MPPVDVERLLTTLREDAPGLRAAGLAALASLPLTDAQWLRVSAYVAWALTDPSAPRWERQRCLESVPRIPVGALRDLTARLAADGDVAAADALVKAEDPRGPGLVQGLLFPKFKASQTEEERIDFGRKLASVGDQRVVRFLRRRCRELRKRSIALARAERARTDHGPPLEAADASNTRLDLAVALARSGHEDELQRVLEDCDKGQVVEPTAFWGDPERAYTQIASSGPVPRLLRRRLRPRDEDDE